MVFVILKYLNTEIILPMTLYFYKGILINQVLFLYLHVITDAHMSPNK